MRSLLSIVPILLLFACNTDQKEKSTPHSPIAGTWKLLTGTIIKKGDTTVTDYTTGREFIKIINNTHFAFLTHDTRKGLDSVSFSAGGGTYTLRDSVYTESLGYCSDRQWEGHDFPFIITLHGDTLTQRGVEKIEAIGVERINVETYTRLASSR